jgi:hypothetical protein
MRLLKNVGRAALTTDDKKGRKRDSIYGKGSQTRKKLTGLQPNSVIESGH